MNRRERRAAKSASKGSGLAFRSKDEPVDRLFAQAQWLHQTGQIQDAEATYREVLARDPEHLPALQHFGVMASQCGQPDVAIALLQRAIALNDRIPDFHFNIGSVLQTVKRWQDAQRHYTRAVALKPDFAEAHFELGRIFLSRKETKDAVRHLRLTVGLRPDHVDAVTALGAALKEEGKRDEATAQWQRALKLDPAHVHARCNLGTACSERGAFLEAEQHWNQALARDPTCVEAYHNFGNALLKQGRFDEAETRYRKVLELQPDDADATAGLARVLLAQGRIAEAIDSARRALQLEETRLNQDLFTRCVRNFVPMQVDDEIAGMLARALQEGWCHPNQLAPLAIALIKLDPEIADCVRRAVAAWPRLLSAGDLFGERGFSAVATHKLLRCVLEAAWNCDIELERFLTMARCALLQRALSADPEPGPDELGFDCALARQCFANEYVFAAGASELEQAVQLRDRLCAAVQSGADIRTEWLAAVGAYFPLHSLPGMDNLLRRSWAPAAAGLLRQQIQEPMEELRLRPTIPALTPISEKSEPVKRQYEGNPYPRWIKTVAPNEPVKLDDHVRQLFPFCQFGGLNLSKGPDVLVVGCGTGQDPIAMAQLFSGARVLAVDLSLASLAYAARKTRELGLGNITYAQADIVNLGSLGRTFDLVEASGVLHHLVDPMAGWGLLLSMLRPAGLMRVALYSKIARRDIVEARKFIAERNYAGTADDIRRFRQDLMAFPDGTPLKKVCNSTDFFTTSMCRDLLFHVQETGFDLDEIGSWIREQKLLFLGFEVDTSVMRSFRSRFAGAESLRDLQCWKIFEEENPDTFGGMYTFWIQGT